MVERALRQAAGEPFLPQKTRRLSVGRPFLSQESYFTRGWGKTRIRICGQRNNELASRKFTNELGDKSRQDGSAALGPHAAHAVVAVRRSVCAFSAFSLEHGTIQRREFPTRRATRHVWLHSGARQHPASSYLLHIEGAHSVCGRPHCQAAAMQLPFAVRDSGSAAVAFAANAWGDCRLVATGSPAFWSWAATQSAEHGVYLCHRRVRRSLHPHGVL